jgi:hypothetical protein
VKFAVIDLHKLGATLPRSNGEVDPAVRQAIKDAMMPTMSRLMNTAPGMLAALKEIEPMYYRAYRAYQFGASSYTYQALAALTSARVRLARVLDIASGRGWHI